jgi:hypothetical protein
MHTILSVLHLTVVVGVVLAAAAVDANDSSCKLLHGDYGYVMRQFIFLDEYEMEMRMIEWELFCKHLNGSNNMTLGELHMAWRNFSSFLPLNECNCDSFETAATVEASNLTRLCVDITELTAVVLGLGWLLLRTCYQRFYKPGEGEGDVFSTTPVDEPTFIRNTMYNINHRTQLQR